MPLHYTQIHEILHAQFCQNYTGEKYIILDPIPLVEYARPFYDGQPREKNGRFARGKRIDVAITFCSPGGGVSPTD